LFPENCFLGVFLVRQSPWKIGFRLKNILRPVDLEIFLRKNMKHIDLHVKVRKIISLV
jgi:hypothetical protein